MAAFDNTTLDAGLDCFNHGREVVELGKTVRELGLHPRSNALLGVDLSSHGGDGRSGTKRLGLMREDKRIDHRADEMRGGIR